MLPAQRKKVDISKLNPQEQQLFAKYGKLPTHRNVLSKMQKERKYFDSGDYALSKAGKAPQQAVGTAIPNPENIPHASPPTTTSGVTNSILSSSTHGHGSPPSTGNGGLSIVASGLNNVNGVGVGSPINGSNYFKESGLAKEIGPAAERSAE